MKNVIYEKEEMNKLIVKRKARYKVEVSISEETGIVDKIIITKIN